MYVVRKKSTVSFVGRSFFDRCFFLQECTRFLAAHTRKARNIPLCELRNPFSRKNSKDIRKNDHRVPSGSSRDVQKHACKLPKIPKNPDCPANEEAQRGPGQEYILYAKKVHPKIHSSISFDPNSVKSRRRRKRHYIPTDPGHHRYTPGNERTIDLSPSKP